MDRRWQKVREIFDDALRREPDERPRFVAEACGKDKSLLVEVETLLASLDSAESFLETVALTIEEEISSRKINKQNKNGGEMKKVFKNRYFMAAALIAAVSTAAFAVIITPGSGVSSTVFVRGSFVDPTDVRFKVKAGNQEVINVNNARETVVQQINIAPGGHTGWHSHPGPVVVVVKSGQMSFYDGDDPSCTVRTYTAGQAFIDSGQGHVHIARNEGTTNLELWATYFDVPPGGAFRIDAPAPGNCGF